MHRWLAEQLDAALAERGTKLNVLGPRGGAKSTIGTLALPLRAAVECWEPYIWIVSDTQHQACAHLENIKAELLDNRRLAEDFPDAVGRGLVWRGNSIVLRNGVTIEAFGTGQRIRGRRRRQHRPTLIVCDDLQNDGHIRSALQREHSRELVPRHADEGRHRADQRRQPGHRPAPRGPGDGTAPHARLDLAHLQGHRPLAGEHVALAAVGGDLHRPREAALPAARPATFYEQHRPAMDAGAIVLWPEEEDLYTLMCMRAEGGRTAFEREKQNSPINPDLCEWPESYFDETIWFETWPAKLAVKTMALDPSKGSDSRRGDYSALVVLGVDRQGMLYVEADLARRPTPQIVADGVEWFRRLRPDVFGVEANQFQDLLGRRVRGRVPPPGHVGRPARGRSRTAPTSRSASAAWARTCRRGACVSRRTVPARGCWSSNCSSFPSATTTTAPTPWKWPCAWRPKSSTAASTTGWAAGCR